MTPQELEPEVGETSMEDPAVEFEVAPITEPFVDEPGFAVGKRLGRENCFVDFERVLIGYEVSNQLSAKVRDLDSVGEVIDRSIEAGGDLIRFQGVSFSIEDTEELQNQARRAAVEDLISKAGQVASLAGVELGKLVYITETGGPVVPQSVNIERAFFKAAAAPTAIEAGQLSIVVNVQGSFEIQGTEG